MINICLCCRELKRVKKENDTELDMYKCKSCFEAMGKCIDCKMYNDCLDYLKN